MEKSKKIPVPDTFSASGEDALMYVKQLTLVVQSLAKRFAQGEYDSVVSESTASRLTAEDLRQVVRDYGRTLVEPPANAYRDLDAVAVKDAEQPTWSVSAPLWTHEEGRSDLTLELTITQDGDRWRMELDDLHVP